MKTIKKFKRAISFVLAFALILTGSLSGLGNTEEVHAAVGYTSYYLHSDWDGCDYGRYKVSVSSGEHIAFCGDKEKDAVPRNTNITSVSESTNSKLRKVLYYGYGGPASVVSDWSTDKGYCYTTNATSYALGNGSYRKAFSNWADEVNGYAAPPASFKVYIATMSGSQYQPLVYWEYEPEGTITLTKSSGNTSITSGNSNYSLEGAVYTVYSGSTAVNTITTNASGKGSISAITEGTYTVKETTAPKGYQLDPNTYTVTVVGGETATVSSTDAPITGKIQVNKSSADTNVTNGNSNYSLKGAKYGVYYNNSLVDTITTDANGYGISGALALGTYTVKEISAPAGYKIDASSYSVSLTNSDTKTVNSKESPEFGTIVLYKKSSNPDITDGNSCYSLKGAKYGIYSGNTLIETLTTDANGYAKSSELPLGAYTVKEISASEGYEIDTKSYNVTVTAGKEATVTSYETPGNDPAYIEVRKINQETGELVTNNDGYASLAGTQFTIKYYAGYYDKSTLPSNADRTWVIEVKELEFEGEVYYETWLQKDYLVSGSDELFYNDRGFECLPLGTITIEETKAADGYTLENGSLKVAETGEVVTDGIYLTQIKEINSVVSLVAGNQFTVSNQPSRGDFEFTKMDADLGKTMANIPFKVTNKETGESYTIYTDENGYYSSNSSYVSHTAENGLWFGERAATDTLGALTFGTYTLEEQRCAANAFKTLYSGSFEITEHDTTLKLPNISNKDTYYPELSTTALEKTSGTHYTYADDEVTITDTVSYKNLKEGHEYTIKGTLMVKSTGKALLNKDGKPVTSQKTFTVKAKDGSTSNLPRYLSGSVSMDFTFDASALAGENIVVYEELYLNGKLVGEHKDINDEKQTVNFPSIRTSAIGKETGANLALADEEITIVDTVSYTNLKPGKEYTVTGTLMDKESGKKLKDANGKVVTAKTTFTAPKADGTVDVVFTFNGSHLAGRTVVAFESLDYNNRLLAVHSDINDRAQTVYIPDVSTSAIDKESNSNNCAADDNAVIVDTVTYKNLVPGNTYRVEGILMDKATEEALLVNGEAVTAYREFVPTKANGTVEITFNFDATGLDGNTVVVFEALSYNNVIIAAHEDFADTNQTIYFPEIGTLAVDKDSSLNISKPDESVTITDTVSYKNLLPGKSYTIKGILMDKETGSAVLVNEKEVVSEVVLEAKDTEGTVDVVFEFDATGLDNKDLVVFEELYYGEILMTSHKDINDEGQTIHFPKLGTEAIAADTDLHITNADEEIVITDTVSYSNLVVGHEYVVTGHLVNKNTGDVITDKDGKEVSASTTFTAEEKDGTVEVEFVFDGSHLAGETIVAFESLSYNDVELAVHADINDDAQTVHIPKVLTSVKDNETETQNSYPDEEVSITDTVSYENLIPGLEYKMVGILMDKDTEEVLLVNELPVTSESVFTPDSPDGTIDVEFVFDGTDMEGRTLVVFETLYLEETEIASHSDLEDVAQTIYFADIKTCAADKESNSKNILADSEVTITDTVSYKNLIPGLEYTIMGVLMDKETNEAVVINDTPVTSKLTFIPEEESGEVKVEFTFDATGFENKDLVVFEELYVNEALIADHSDIEDVAQTVYFPEIKTSAADKADSDREMTASGEVTIVDTVTYKNLIVGETYKVSGVLMDKTSGEIIKVRGKAVTAETTFVAEAEEGTVEVVFTFKADGIGDREVVVFEKLYTNDTEIANHEDLTDVNQTITFTAPPVKTGDIPNTLFVLLFGVAAIAVAGALVTRRKRT